MICIGQDDSIEPPLRAMLLKMKILKIYNYNNKNYNLKNIDRIAVRGIIINENNELLMIYSKKNGDYKFPGGGLKDFESDYDALKRELLEELGVDLIEIIEEYGSIYEFNCPSDMANKTFNMKSIYYRCKCNKKIKKQKLDKYERDLKFIPKYVNINEAIKNNNKMLAEKLMPRWTKRDTYILELLQDNEK